MHHHAKKEKILEQFAEVGGYSPGQDPPLEQTKKLFKLLCQRVTRKEAMRMACDPQAYMKWVEEKCKRDFQDLVLHTEKGTVAKDLLHKIGVGGYTKVVKNMVKNRPH